MAAHAAPTSRRTATGHPGGMMRGTNHHGMGSHSPLLARVPIPFGIAYGAYASFMARDGGAASFTQLWLALASGVGFAVIMAAILFTQRTMRRELRSLVWGVFLGGSVGFLRSLGDFSIWQSAGVGLAIGVSVIVVTYYWWHTHEESGTSSSA